MRLNPPSIFVFLISVLLAALALISKFGAIGINVPRYLPHQEYWLAMVAYMVLMVAVAIAAPAGNGLAGGAADHAVKRRRRPSRGWDASRLVTPRAFDRTNRMRRRQERRSQEGSAEEAELGHSYPMSQPA